MAEWFFVPGNHSSGLLYNLTMDYRSQKYREKDNFQYIRLREYYSDYRKAFKMWEFIEYANPPSPKKRVDTQFTG